MPHDPYQQQLDALNAARTRAETALYIAPPSFVPELRQLHQELLEFRMVWVEDDQWRERGARYMEAINLLTIRLATLLQRIHDKNKE